MGIGGWGNNWQREGHRKRRGGAGGGVGEQWEELEGKVGGAGFMNVVCGN